MLFLAMLHSVAADFTNLHDFRSTDGDSPRGTLLVSSNTLYGITYSGGLAGNGTLFALHTDGTGFTNLHHFTVAEGFPNSGVLLSGSMLYGTTPLGGSNSRGMIYRINTNGSAFTNFYTFTNAMNGAEPDAALVAFGTELYGMCSSGGTGNVGTIFQLSTTTLAFATLHNFNGADGQSPSAGLLCTGDTLYGPTTLGGAVSLGSSGTLFKINTNASGFVDLYNFTSTSFNGSTLTNGDGANPDSVLVLSGNRLYGTTSAGGLFGDGTVFAVNIDGTGFTNLHNFAGPDGLSPVGGLVLYADQLYGTANSGGDYSQGTIFKINTDGTGFTKVYQFTPADFNGTTYTNGDGYAPSGGLTISGRTLFGTAQEGGRFGYGTVFALPLPPPYLNFALSGAGFVLTWADPAFSLQAAPVATGLYTNIAGATSPYTNAPAGQQKFFRLHAPGT
jgi:uncharacterized repeat protein (TIGR03803 family)